MQQAAENAQTVGDEADFRLTALPGADACVVVGDPRSNNTANLVLLAQSAGIPAFRVASAADLRREWFSGTKSLVLTSGASTPRSRFMWVMKRPPLTANVKPGGVASRHATYDVGRCSE